MTKTLCIENSHVRGGVEVQSAKLQCSLAIINSNSKELMGLMRQESQDEFQPWPLLYHLPVSCTACALGLSVWAMDLSFTRAYDEISLASRAATNVRVMSQWIPSFCLLCSANSSGEQPLPLGAPSGFLGKFWGHRHASLSSPDVCPWMGVCLSPRYSVPTVLLGELSSLSNLRATQHSVDTTTTKEASPADPDVMGARVGRVWGLPTDQNKHKAITDSKRCWILNL